MTAFLQLHKLLIKNKSLLQVPACCNTTYYAEACNGPHHPVTVSNTAHFEEMLQLWRVVVKTAFDLIGPILKFQASCSRAKRVTAQPTGWSA